MNKRFVQLEGQGDTWFWVVEKEMSEEMFLLHLEDLRSVYADISMSSAVIDFLGKAKLYNVDVAVRNMGTWMTISGTNEVTAEKITRFFPSDVWKA